MYNKPLIFVVIAVLVVALVYSSFTPFIIFALPPDTNYGKTGECFYVEGDERNTRCCWEETDILNPEGPTIKWCQTCDSTTAPATDCGPVFIETPSPMGPIGPPLDGVLEQPPPPPSGPAAPLQDGVLEQSPSEGVAPPLTRGQGALPEDGALQQQQQQQQQPTDEEAGRTVEPPAEETTQPPTEPLSCPEGQILDEETRLCVLEEQDAAEEEPAESQPEQEQPSEESDSGDEGTN